MNTTFLSVENRIKNELAKNIVMVDNEDALYQSDAQTDWLFADCEYNVSVVYQSEGDEFYPSYNFEVKVSGENEEIAQVLAAAVHDTLNKDTYSIELDQWCFERDCNSNEIEVEMTDIPNLDF